MWYVLRVKSYHYLSGRGSQSVCRGVTQHTLNHKGATGCPRRPLLLALSSAAILGYTRFCEVWTPPSWITIDLARFGCCHLGICVIQDGSAQLSQEEEADPGKSGNHWSKMLNSTIRSILSTLFLHNANCSPQGGIHDKSLDVSEFSVILSVHILGIHYVHRR